MKRWKILVLISAFLLVVQLPTASAATVELKDTVRLQRENFTANNSIPLNLSDPQQLKEYSPVYNFWPATNNGILVDSTLPPDILPYNKTGSITLNSTFRISSHTAADGASHMKIRLPVATNITNITSIHLVISRGKKTILDYFFEWDLVRSRGEPLSKYNVSYYNISYLGISFTLLYVDVRGMFLADVEYNYSLQIDGVQNAYLFVAGFDLFGDNVTGYTLDGVHMRGDPMVGFLIEDMVTNGFSEFYQPFMRKQYHLNETYNGPRYVSFAIGVVSTNDNQNVTVRITTIDSTTGLLYAANGTTIHVSSTGPIMIYGHVQVNFSHTNTIYVTLYSNNSTGISVLTDGEDTTPIAPDSLLETRALAEIQKTYLAWYMDIVVTQSKYYYPFFIRLPGTWQENVQIVMQMIGAEALIPVVLTGLYAGQNFLTVANFSLHVLFAPFILAYQALKSLVDWALAGFNWFVNVVRDFLMDAVQYWLWIAEILITTLFNVFFWLLAAVLGNAFVNAMVRLPKEGINAVFEEFGRGLSTVNQIIAPLAKAFRKVVPK